MELPRNVQPSLRPRAAVAFVMMLMMMSAMTSRGGANSPTLAQATIVAKHVTATCSDASGCKPSLGQAECSTKQVCQLECPATSRQDFPDTEIPLKSWTGSGTSSIGCKITTDTTPTNNPASANSSNGLLDINSTSSSSCRVTKDPTNTSSGRAAISFWVFPACSGNCTLINIAPKKASTDVTVLVSNNKLCINSFCSSDTISNWTHVIVQISNGKADIVVNGSPPGQSSNIPDLTDTVGVTVGSSSTLPSGDMYQLYDVRYYSDILTFREIQQVFSNADLQKITPESNCRCPHTHLDLKQDDHYICTDGKDAEKQRLETKFFLPDKLLDGNDSTKWAGPGSGNFILTVDMEQDYQVDKVQIEFQNTPSGEISINLPKSENKQLTCNQRICSTEMSGSVPDRIVQVFNLTFTQPRPNAVVSSIVVTGRCNCNGHGTSCDLSVTPYKCTCSPETQGNQCESCGSMYYRTSSDSDCKERCNCDNAGVRNTARPCDENGGACLCKDNVEGERCNSCKDFTYDFNASNPLGCTNCRCHQNGSTGCNKTDGTCFCKANVALPSCNDCQDKFYDVGPLKGPDECVACLCNTDGIIPSSPSACDKATGQCSCKDHVQGKKCNECKDEYYGLEVSQSKECLRCDCNAIGSLSKVCDKTTGQCHCEDGGNSSRKCMPQVKSLTPRYGPLIGGTVVTITGQLLGNGSQLPTIFVGNISHQVIENNMSTIVFKTSQSASLGSFPVKVMWNTEPAVVDFQNFTFEPNPQLDRNNLPTVSMFTSGGCGVRFLGSYFKSVAAPQIVMKDGSGKTAYGMCRPIQQYLHCTSPDLGRVKNIDANTLRFGLYLDGVRGIENLGPVQVKADPRLDFLGSYDFQYPFETTVKISGSGLTGGCDRNEIRVYLGVISCDIVSLSDSEIECEPPQNLRGSKGTAIKVSIGSHIDQRIGTLNYLQIYETSYFIGIMCGIGAVILLVIVIIIFCRCRRRRKNTGSRQSQIRLVEKASNGSYPVQNQYSELPSVSGGVSNNGFHPNLIQAETVIREPKEMLPPTVKEVDLMTDFLHRVEPSLWEAIKAAMVTASDLTLGRVCTNKGQYARIIDGQFATQRAGQKTQKKVTIKTLKDPLPAEGMLPLWAGAALRECLRLHRYNDDSVVSIIGLALAQDRFHVIYPFMENRTLKDHIVDAKKEFSVRQLAEFGLQVAEGLGYLHSKDLVHRDLATRNCMVNAQSEVKISDASFSWDFYRDEYMYDSARERYLPLRWMAPESLMNGYYDARTDVWSLGVMLWELLTRGCLPFHEVVDTQVKDYVVEGYILGKPQNCSDQLYEVMKECWAQQNEHRPAVSAVIKLLGDELTEGGVEQDDVYVNMGTVEGYYQNQDTMGKPRRKAPLPPRA